MGKMKSMMMDLEDKFVEEVADRIKNGACISAMDLIQDLKKDGCFDLIRHMSLDEQQDFVWELWSDEGFCVQ